MEQDEKLGVDLWETESMRKIQSEDMSPEGLEPANFRNELWRIKPLSNTESLWDVLKVFYDHGIWIKATCNNTHCHIDYV